ncbi:MAG TPA: PepSY domain-containing protein [Verrucomicrobiae bacterium]|nr:PepSY domain-containing protein [Verrucomicrobiae bacterium]
MKKLSRLFHAVVIQKQFNLSVEALTNNLNPHKNMNPKLAIVALLAVSLIAGCESESEERSEHQSNQAELLSQAKISKDDAVKIAMNRVPDGSVKEAELEKEHGKLIWSFDMATPGMKDITEVNVDAITGSVVGVHKESPESEKKEADDEKGK